ncbi:MAG: hypothetical protein ACRDLY_19895, partial [Thermoleophilaceae bacterium]
ALPYSEKAKLDALAGHLMPDGPPPQLFFFARAGFDEHLTREASANERVRLVTPAELFPQR